MVRQRGFTLIEVMITVAIVAILASIAIPSYSEYVTRSKLTQAHSQLAQMRVRLEQYFQDNRTYVGACAAGTVAQLPANDDFTYSCPTLTATTFIARADGLASEGVGGFAFTIDQTNQRTTVSVGAGWSGGGSNCWVTKKGGSC